jgi:hypothetical protein
MFLSEQCLCPAGIGAARARLAGLAGSGWLGAACAAAYQDGLDQLLWTWPPDDTPNRSRLVQAHFLDPTHRPGSTTMGMRWEATSATGAPFPALDATITLAPEGRRTQITLTGVYRSPLGPPGAGLDRVLLRQAATSAISSLLARLNGALAASTRVPAHPSPPQPPQTAW